MGVLQKTKERDQTSYRMKICTYAYITESVLVRETKSTDLLHLTSTYPRKDAIKFSYIVIAPQAYSFQFVKKYANHKTCHHATHASRYSTNFQLNQNDPNCHNLQ
jgi:hypothetical protein